VIYPFYLCILLVVIQTAINHLLSGSDFKCGCKLVPDANGGPATNVCGLQYSNSDQAPWCGVPDPTPWPAVLQVPEPQDRATKSAAFPALPEDPSCRALGTCATTIPYTGSNKTTADGTHFSESQITIVPIGGPISIDARPFLWQPWRALCWATAAT
jgi:hypothetical protein